MGDQRDEDIVKEGGEIELKSQILADFEIGNEASEEEMTISDSDLEKDMKKDVNALPVEEYVEKIEKEEKTKEKENDIVEEEKKLEETDKVEEESKEIKNQLLADLNLPEGSSEEDDDEGSSEENKPVEEKDEDNENDEKM